MIANTLQRPKNTVYEETDSYYQGEKKTRHVNQRSRQSRPQRTLNSLTSKVFQFRWG